MFVDKLLLRVHWEDLEEDDGRHDHGSGHLPAVVLPPNTNNQLGVGEQTGGVTTKLLKCHEGVLEKRCTCNIAPNSDILYKCIILLYLLSEIVPPPRPPHREKAISSRVDL